MRRITFILLLLLSLFSVKCIGQDLVVTDVTYELEQIQFQEFIGQITIMNIGSVTNNEFNVANIYFSKDIYFDNSDVYAGFISFTDLNIGESITKTITGGAAQFGINANADYKYVIVRADYRGEVDEEDETNNLWVGEVNIQTIEVDLQLASFNIGGISSVRQGASLGINISLKNLGDYHIHNIWYEYFLSTDEYLDEADTRIGYLNWAGFYWEEDASEYDEVVIPHLNPDEYYLIVKIDSSGQEIDITDANFTNNVVTLTQLDLLEEESNTILNFDQESGTRLWIEDGLEWAWDNTGGDRIRHSIPYLGSGHAMTTEGDCSKLIFPDNSDVGGVWIRADYSQNISELKLMGLNENLDTIYIENLNPLLYDYNYVYKTLNWESIKYLEFEYTTIDEMFPTSVMYDELDYSINPDIIPPTINCIENKKLCANSLLPDYASQIVVTDNRVGWRIEQNPLSGSIFEDDLNVEMKAIDAAGNWNSCSFQVIAIEETHHNLEAYGCDSYISPSGKEFEFSGLYQDTIPNSIGCDSIISIDLTIISSSTASITAVSCDNYLSPSSKVFLSSGMYLDTIPNAAGCDSIISIDLTIHNISYASVSETVCDFYVAPSGKTYRLSGTYKDTIMNDVGCDSIVTIDLTVNKSNGASLTVASCKTYTSPSGKDFINSGMYLDTILNAVGCDSIISIDLTMNTSSYASISESVCSSYQAPSGKVYQSTGVYKDTITNSMGCDSIITIDLKFNNSDTTRLFAKACNRFISPSGKIWTLSGTYTDTLINQAGCDSIIIVDIIFNENSTSKLTVSSCSEYISPSGKVLRESGQYYDKIQNTEGCDSLMVIDLTIMNANKYNVSKSICEMEYSSPSGNIYTETDIYYDTLTNFIGCDSIIITNLWLGSKSSSQITTTACGSYVSPSGKMFTSTGVYLDTIPNQSRCDSVIEIDLRINTDYEFDIDLSICLGDSVLYNKVYYSTDSTYEINLVSSTGCDSIANLKLVTPVCTSIEQRELENVVEVYPNPTKGEIVVKLTDKQELVFCRIISESGMLNAELTFEETKALAIEIDGPTGIYFVEVFTPYKSLGVVRIVKE